MSPSYIAEIKRVGERTEGCNLHTSNESEIGEEERCLRATGTVKTIKGSFLGLAD